jgi:secreted trypsin-like serine protease
MTCDGLHCGIASWGIECGMLGYPGVNAETSHFIDWINGKIKNP